MVVGAYYELSQESENLQCWNTVNLVQDFGMFMIVNIDMFVRICEYFASICQYR